MDSYLDAIKVKYGFEKWHLDLYSPFEKQTFAPDEVRMPMPEGYDLIESRAYGVPGSFRNIYRKRGCTEIKAEIIAVPCEDAAQAQDLLLKRLYFMEAPDAARDDRWGCNVGFYQKSDSGASQMVCKGNLFVSIITWTDGKENADRMIETMWNSFM